MYSIGKKHDCAQMESLKLTIECFAAKQHTPITDPETGEICCKHCGQVISGTIFVTEEVSHSDGPNKSQHHPVNYKMGEKGLGTVITKGGKVARKLQDAQRLIRTDKNNTKGLVEFSKISDKLHLPEHVIEEAVKTYTGLRKKGFLKGRDIAGVAGACAYLFARKRGLNITMREVCKKLIINEKALYSYYTDLCLLLKIDSSMLKINMPKDYMNQLFSKLDLDRITKTICMKYVEDMERLDYHVGKNPISIAATCIYLGCRLSSKPIVQRAIADVAGTTEVTMRNILRDYRTLPGRRLEV